MVMKKRSEVCKIVGVTRKTLEGYDDLGLLHPTSKTEQGYWLYDEKAIAKLFNIQLFVEAGYDRKKIKKIYEAKDVDIFDQYRQVVDSLKAKRERIDGMIDMLNAMLNGIESLPTEAARALLKADITNIYVGKSYTDYLTDSINIASKATEESRLLNEFGTYLAYRLVALGCMKDQDPESEAVQERTA